MPTPPSGPVNCLLDHEAWFGAQRERALALAWRMLGSRHEAQDLVQDLWLKWHEVDLADVQQPQAYLARMATHLCLDRLREAKRQREAYVGTWLPEPCIDLGAGEAADPQLTPPEQLARMQSVSIAFLHVLERLSALERAAFLLHDVFDAPFAEVARQLDRSEVACRQLASRARARLRAQGLGDAPQATARARIPERQAQLLQAFAHAVTTGDVQALAGLLTEDARLLSDGGGVVTAIPRPVQGALAVARVLCALAHGWQQAGGALEDMRWARINGAPGVVALAGPTRIGMALALQPAVGGRLQGVYFMRNPGRLRDVSQTGAAAGGWGVHDAG